MYDEASLTVDDAARKIRMDFIYSVPEGEREEAMQYWDMKWMHEEEFGIQDATFSPIFFGLVGFVVTTFFFSAIYTVFIFIGSFGVAYVSRRLAVEKYQPLIRDREFDLRQIELTHPQFKSNHDRLVDAQWKHWFYLGWVETSSPCLG